MAETKKTIFNLEERTFQFAKRVRKFLEVLPPTFFSRPDRDQLFRSSGSVGANYIEANESLGKKDFLLHIKISRKEAKESRFWLMLISLPESNSLNNELKYLIQEALELMNIFGSIYHRSV